MPAAARHLTSEIDIFSDSILHDPFPAYRSLRDIGPAVYLARRDVWFLGRYDQVRAALTTWQVFSSARGIGLNPTINKAWEHALICVDPPMHTRMRKFIMDRLGPRHLKPIEQTIERHAVALADRLVARGAFDAVTDLAYELPVTVIMDLIGWPDSIRGRLIDLARGSFDACGPENARMQASLPRLSAMMDMIAQVYDEDSLASGGFGSTIADAARRGDISRDAAIGLLAGYVVAAFDTTINAIAAGVFHFASCPEQWEVLRDEPALVPRAFNEIIRMDAPIQNFSRIVTRDVDLGEGAVIPAGARVVISYGSANRDERHFADPDKFDIQRREGDHLAFGLGNHSCAGQGIARMEAHAVFAALAGRVAHFALSAAPVRELNNITRGFARLPIRATGCRTSAP